MKRLLSIILSAALILSVSACGQNAVAEKEQIQLVNRMTETELERADKHKLTLLDEPELTDPVAEYLAAEHSVQFVGRELTQDEMLVLLNASRDELTEEEYNEGLEWIEQNPDGICSLTACFVDGYILFDYIPLLGNYDGGQIHFSVVSEEGDPSAEAEICLEDPDAYYDWLISKHLEDGETQEDAELAAAKVRLAYEAYLSGDYEMLPYTEIDYSDPSIWEPSDNSYADYRSEWEYDRSEIEGISEYIDEYSIYDEELDVEFLVHAVLPPDYDPEETYPVFLLTDGVYRFGNTPQMRQAMEEGRASGVILVTLGYNYHMNGRDEENRYEYMVMQRAKLLDFITDNLMPYLGENYSIDYADSSLYGHSDGGIFTHYALFNSDLYDNQPFGHYIIGSPAFWSLYNGASPEERDAAGYENDYGYFDRHDTLDKTVFLCGGSQEDPDYEQYYRGHMTTLEGLAALNDRLEEHGADVTYKLYDSHHYQFIPEMLVEYVEATYPA
ncbi:MAG: hypothetical protein J6Z43_08675 [Clostridiales bacterium]|nr:hypothetical protein [Clostridiales bacterium]